MQVRERLHNRDERRAYRPTCATSQLMPYTRLLKRQVEMVSEPLSYLL